jgi:hypothetical protein
VKIGTQSMARLKLPSSTASKGCPSIVAWTWTTSSTPMVSKFAFCPEIGGKLSFCRSWSDCASDRVFVLVGDLSQDRAASIHEIGPSLDSPPATLKDERNEYVPEPSEYTAEPASIRRNRTPSARAAGWFPSVTAAASLAGT